MTNDASLRADLIALFDEAVRAVAAESAMPPIIPAAPGGRTFVLAVGKAAADMMRVFVARSHGSNFEGLVVTAYGHLPDAGATWPNVEVIEAGHPYPDENSVRAAHLALDRAKRLQQGDNMLVLLSGGGSALLAAPAPGVSLADKQAVTRALLRSGAAIGEINGVRKHLSAVKGGRLAAAAAPAQVTTWIISDVPGDDPALVASGPTLPDRRASLESASETLERYRIIPPESVAAALRNAANALPPADHPGFTASETRIIARSADALAAAARRACELGYRVTDLGDRLQGEARLLGAEHAALAVGLAGQEDVRHAILSGGETTVTVANAAGRGGRNLEYLLGLAIALGGAPAVWAMACDTDGIDGASGAAGAIVTPTTLARAGQAGLDPQRSLGENNAFTFFEALGDLVVTGPTLTNVNDFRAILIDTAG